MKAPLPLFPILLFSLLGGCFGHAESSSEQARSPGNGDLVPTMTSTQVPSSREPDDGPASAESGAAGPSPTPRAPCHKEYNETVSLTTEGGNRTIHVACWPNVSHASNHVLVKAHNGSAEFWVSRGLTVQEPRAMIRLLKANQALDQELQLDLRDSENAFFNVSFTEPGPFLLVVQCMCSWYINLDSAGLAYERGPANLTMKQEYTVSVTYSATSPETILKPELLFDETSMVFDRSLLHWTFDFAFNARADVTLMTPNGSELIRLNCQGLQATGHFSEGYRPLDEGSWTLRLDGHGWFDLKVTAWNLTSEGYNKYFGGVTL